MLGHGPLSAYIPFCMGECKTNVLQTRGKSRAQVPRASRELRFHWGIRQGAVSLTKASSTQPSGLWQVEENPECNSTLLGQGSAETLFKLVFISNTGTNVVSSSFHCLQTENFTYDYIGVIISA